MNLNDYQTHLDILRQRFDKALAATGFDQVILSAGDKVMIQGDDHTYPYSPRAFAQQWLPYDLDAGTCVLYRPGDKPVLYWPSRADFWHLTPQAPQGDWTGLWDVQAAGGPEEWLAAAVRGRKTAWIGRDQGLADYDVVVEPAELKARLEYDRAWKTAFEIACLEQASTLGALGHKAAEQAFYQGESEAGVYREFLRGSSQLESNEPYPGIVGINESAATLHYERRLFTPPSAHRTLLIDAGAKVNGYASDITRTHTQDNARFTAIRQALVELSTALVEGARPGVAMADLHREAFRGVAAILKAHDLCRLSVDEQVDKGIPRAFFPHGLGHLLGLQVHDVGGHQQDVTGTRYRDPEHGALRLTRTLSPGMVLTIEPGLYFIPMLLDKMVRDTPEHGVDLAAVEELKPWGGVRWEDNILITDTGSRNLTDEAFART